MKVDRKAKFCIFFVIAILALGLSNFAAAFTGDFVTSSFPGINDTDKMIALDDDNFAPASINAVYEQKKVVEVNETDNATDSNSTIEEDDDDDSDDTKPNGNNQNGNSDSNNNENGGGDNSNSKPKPSHSDDVDDE
ncbi:hypothetical protein [Methanobrevibacter sp.]|uniref:hypothetical protein n=1 Tax=Methanobrevibacter sp. TaxID=66852 RepID=UPI0025E5FE2E|nr:hypothetical protein [Methanobrevibacter sp.]MBQ2962174.1 hypothetical protein [Methanobrevibacter sp.]